MYATLTAAGNIFTRATTKEAALAAAVRITTKTREAMSVVWLKDGSPKMWLAHVEAGRATKTEFWNAGDVPIKIGTDWIRVTPDGGRTRYDVRFVDTENPDVVVIKHRRDTGLEFTQKIKPQSANWKRAVKLAREAKDASIDPVVTVDLLRREFPDFDQTTLPAIPEGFECTAWANDALPTWHEGQSADEPLPGRLMIGIDFADKALREDPDPAIKRFSLSIYFGDCSPEPILDTDDWSVLEAAVRLVGYIRKLDLGFHPDTRGRDYVMHSDGSRVFTDAEADDIDACVAAVSGACDVYEFGLAVWKAMGLDV